MTPDSRPAEPAGGPLCAAARQTGVLLEMIKFQHTVFAMPFALTGMLLAANGWPDARTILWIVAACVFARTAAMSFNRWADRHIDARNPRTAARAIPAGLLRPGFVLATAAVSAALFVFAAGRLNTLALALSPIALAVLLGYSYCKRFTWLSHFVLGLALAIAPTGAWIAVRGSFALPPVMLSLTVMLWTAGFDIIYACQDFDVDRREGLHSIPARFGIGPALRTSTLLHVLCTAALISAGAFAGVGWLFHAGTAVVAALLVVEHRLVNPRDLSRIDAAFFKVNSWVGMVVFAFAWADIAMRR